MLSDIPVLAPATPLLDTIDQGASLRELKGEQLLQLFADGVVQFIQRVMNWDGTSWEG